MGLGFGFGFGSGLRLGLGFGFGLGEHLVVEDGGERPPLLSVGGA